MERLIIKGAREHNLKNIDLDLPRNKLIVVSGLSGSGKSSLAFDTVFAEGQRRYVESLSAYARQFLGRMDKPDVDYIEGLSPAISIEQKTTNRNPRSTVGTITEIYDYFRLLWSRIGIPHDPSSGKPVEKQSVDQIIEQVLQLPSDARVMILAPIVRGRKGTHQKVLEDAKKTGFIRARINGEMVHLEDQPVELEKNKKHSIDIVIDRLIVKSENRSRIAESVEAALEATGGLVQVHCSFENQEWEQSFSEQYYYPDSNLSFPELEPRLFSFNSPFGACPACSGLGIMMEFDLDKIIPDKSKSFYENGIQGFKPSSNWVKSKFEALARHFDFSLRTPFQDLPAHIQEILVHGTKETIEFTYINKEKTGRFEYNSSFDGILRELERRYHETTSTGMKDWFESLMSQRVCSSCNGKRLKPEALSVLINKKSIHDINSLSVRDALSFFSTIELDSTQSEIARQILKEINDRLGFMESVGLDYLTLDRSAGTLSGGEAQRIRLATQIGSSLVGVLYILDEPSIGLHQRDNERLIQTLLHLRDIGNTLIVVEHDEQTLKTADYIVDLGPGAGVHGGYVVAAGNLEEVMSVSDSLTGQYLAGKLYIPVPAERRTGNGKFITITGACEHNLRGIDVSFPLSCLSVITGVSGSGKSTLMSDVLYPWVANHLNGSHHVQGEVESISGLEHLDKVINIDQSPIGRTPRSNPATYVGLFTPIRDLFASLPESKARGYQPGRFSFNVKGGRCEHCEGAGTIKIEMHFLPDVYVTCDVCKGQRFNRETLDIHYKGKNIHEVLEMPVDEAVTFFENIPKIHRKLETLHAVGLGYIKLGQSALTLSGGEAQRVKLSLELSKRSTGKTLYILDEPTTGLHFADVMLLMKVLQQLVELGNTIILIEHNLDVIKQADYIVDLGPEGGDKGGTLVVSGSPEDVAQCQESHTGRFLREFLEFHHP
ncbi:excinuclease ABC subunit UvrA [Spirochaeta lutea]|uniref:UvrABC system protein A n=1 Tax=Spirochaeta lutea TaxID=1480694 RepID=A0A098R1T0_9SPIO|nr:excinuclease ABC subunit UvrA [Spirochaeta lutea]KGE73731.1 excinuclease ABC subunit A [Spirochaeta lutea]